MFAPVATAIAEMRPDSRRAPHVLYSQTHAQHTHTHTHTRARAHARAHTLAYTRAFDGRCSRLIRCVYFPRERALKLLDDRAHSHSRTGRRYARVRARERAHVREARLKCRARVRFASFAQSVAVSLTRTTCCSVLAVCTFCASR